MKYIDRSPSPQRMDGVTPVHGPLRVNPLLALAVVLLIVCTLAVMAPGIAPALPLVFLNVAVLFAAKRALAPAVTAPALYFAIFLSFNGLAGFVFSNSLSEARGSGAVYQVLTPNQTLDTALLFFLASTLICLGAIVGYRFLNAEIRSFDVFSSLKFEGLQRMIPLILFAATLVLGGIVMAVGPAELLQRESYLLATRPGIITILTIASMGMIIALGVVLAGKNRSHRWFAFLLLLLFASYFISLGSRRLALIPILVMAGYILAGGRFNMRLVSLSVLSGGLLLALPLHFRQHDTHGLLPYLQSLRSFVFDSESIEANINNVLVGFRIVGLTAFDRPAIPWSTFLTSVNPLPGELANWYEISNALRINIYSPYGAIGEIGNRGWAFTIFWFLLFGIALGVMQRYNMRLLINSKYRIIGLLILGILAIAAIQSTQYNLRTEMRLIYYVIFLLVAAGSAGLYLRSRPPQSQPGSRIRPKINGRFLRGGSSR